jgi:hypothetical protein
VRGDQTAGTGDEQAVDALPGPCTTDAELGSTVTPKLETGLLHHSPRGMASVPMEAAALALVPTAETVLAGQPATVQSAAQEECKQGTEEEQPSETEARQLPVKEQPIVSQQKDSPANDVPSTQPSLGLQIKAGDRDKTCISRQIGEATASAKPPVPPTESTAECPTPTGARPAGFIRVNLKGTLKREETGEQQHSLQIHGKLEGAAAAAADFKSRAGIAERGIHSASSPPCAAEFEEVTALSEARPHGTFRQGFPAAQWSPTPLPSVSVHTLALSDGFGHCSAAQSHQLSVTRGQSTRPGHLIHH